jgi:putative DNA primase/helicase
MTSTNHQEPAKAAVEKFTHKREDTQTHVIEVVEYDFERVPEELKNRRQWIVWRYELRNGKWTKVPYNARNAGPASSTDLETWVYFGDAAQGFENGGWHGLGFVFSSGDPYAGVDLDDVRDPETGEIEERAQRVINAFDGSYMEVSPSGTGVHIILRGKVREALKKDWIETYSQERYFTVTGVAL